MISWLIIHLLGLESLLPIYLQMMGIRSIIPLHDPRYPSLPVSLREFLLMERRET